MQCADWLKSWQCNRIFNLPLLDAHMSWLQLNSKVSIGLHYSSPVAFNWIETWSMTYKMIKCFVKVMFDVQIKQIKSHWNWNLWALRKAAACLQSLHSRRFFTLSISTLQFSIFVKKCLWMKWDRNWLFCIFFPLLFNWNCDWSDQSNYCVSRPSISAKQYVLTVLISAASDQSNLFFCFVSFFIFT